MTTNSFRTALLATLALAAVPFATGCAPADDSDDDRDDDVSVEVAEPGMSPTGITVDLAGACATKGKVYSPETGTCLDPIPEPGQPGIAPTVCQAGEELVGIYCYPTGVYPRPAGHEADCRSGTVKYGSLCVSAIEASCDPQYAVSTLGAAGYYCGPNSEVSGAIAESLLTMWMAVFGK